MTKEEMVAMLKRSVEEWNEWRNQNPEIKIDLKHADLKGTNLKSAILRGANMHGTYLNNANLHFAVLSFVNFRNASLINTNLSAADLTRADFLSSTLRRVDFRNAKLYNTNFRKSNLFYSIFNDTDLRKLRNIDQINYIGPSYLDSTTFQKSQGQIPETFLKGCGLSDWEIESVKLYNPKLTPTEVTDILYKMDELRNEKPLQFHNLFISYNHKDAPFADALEKHLDAKGIRFWRDVHDAPAGRLDKIVLREMKDRVVLLLFSKNSVNSDWVEFEIENARRLEKEQGRDVLCPIAIDDAWQTCNWSPILMNQIKKYHVLDFSGWEDSGVMERQFEKLLTGLDLFYKK